MADKASVGRIVRYVLTGGDIVRASALRVHGSHVGNPASEGDEVPLLIVRVWPDEYGPGVPGVNGQAFLDGNDSLWVTSAREGTTPGTWHWPERVGEPVVLTGEGDPTGGGGQTGGGGGGGIIP